MKYYESKYTGAEVDALLGKVESGEVGGKVTVDSALSTESENPVQNKVVTEELNKKATSKALDSLRESVVSLEGEVVRKGDYSPENKVGTADDLAGRGESVPASFGFRASGGKSIKDGRAYIKRIKGNSVVWNQYIQNADFRNGTQGWYGYGVLLSVNADGSVRVTNERGDSQGLYQNYEGSIQANNKVLIWINYKRYGNTSSSVRFFLGKAVGGYDSATVQVTQSQEWCAAIISTTDNIISFRLYPYADGEVNSYCDIFNCGAINLTKMFQAGNEPTTIEEFYARVATLGVDMNAYNEGQVIHCNTESIKSVGDNAWDEEWELGYIQESGLFESDSRIRSKNFTKVIPNETYYFYGHYGYGIYFFDADMNYVTTLYVNNGKLQIPSNAAYLKFNFPADYGTIYKGDYMITLVHSGWKQDTDAGYQPYWQDTLPLPIIRKYFPQGMKSAGSAHDEIRFNKASGKWEYSKGKIKSVDMGTLNWSAFTTMNGLSRTSVTISDFIGGQGAEKSNILCAKFVTIVSNTSMAGNEELGIFGYTNNRVFVLFKEGDYTDAASFKADMQGVILYYESNDWEWVELDAEDQNFRDYYNVADFGTEQSQSNVPSAAFSADIIYQFNAVDMIREHEIEITELQNVIATMQAQLASLTNL